MKFVVAFLLLFPCVCFAQKIKDSLYFTSMKTYKISDDYKLNNISKLPFTDLEVWDVRGDTTSIGFSKANSATVKKVDFQNGLANEIYTFAKSNYSFQTTPDDTVKLVVIIKTFRASNFANVDYLNEDNTMQWSDGLILYAELFLYTKGNFRALYKIDTTLKLPQKSFIENAIIPDAFHIIFYKLENKNLPDVHIGKTAFSIEQMQHHSEEFKNIPILKDSILNKGVYKTFSEFKTNKPSITNFEIKTGKFTDELYITENNQTYPLQDLWGYCDGQKLFIRSTDNFFELIKCGGTFNTLAFKSLKKNQNVLNSVAAQAAANTLLYGMPIFSYDKGSSKYQIKTTAFQLDMQTGEIF